MDYSWSIAPDQHGPRTAQTGNLPEAPPRPKTVVLDLGVGVSGRNPGGPNRGWDSVPLPSLIRNTSPHRYHLPYRLKTKPPRRSNARPMEAFVL